MSCEEKKKTLILYAYFHRWDTYTNLCYFLLHGVYDTPEYHYIFIVNGDAPFTHFPHQKNVEVIRRDNTGFDFGAYGHVLSTLDVTPFDFFVCMNATVIGPLFRTPEETTDWVRLFTSHLGSHEIKLFGTTIVALPPHDMGGYGPKVEGFFWCTDRQGVMLLRADPHIFQNHPSKTSAIVHGEYGLSKCLLNTHGFNIGCMLSRYQGIDWRDQRHWTINNNRHPSRRDSFFGQSVDPYEVVFHKWHWAGHPHVLFDEVVRPHILRTNQHLFHQRHPETTFDPQMYTSLHPDLRTMSCDEAREHFFLYGMAEQRSWTLP